MTDLLSQLEAATEGSRELDIAIAEHVIGTGWASDSEIPHYSTNLQDAVSLVPEGWSWFVGWQRVTPHMPGRAQLLNARAVPSEIREQAATTCIALCIAIIKAHESNKPKDTYTDADGITRIAEPTEQSFKIV